MVGSIRHSVAVDGRRSNRAVLRPERGAVSEFLAGLSAIIGWELGKYIMRQIRIARTRSADRAIAKSMLEGMLEVTAYPADPKWHESDVFTAAWYERHPEERGMGTDE